MSDANEKNEVDGQIHSSSRFPFLAYSSSFTLNHAGYPPRLITIFSRSLIVLLPRLVMSHYVLAIFLAAAYFSQRSSILYLVPVEPPRLKILNVKF